MELPEILAIVGKPDELIRKIQGLKTFDKITTYQAQYDPKKHDVHDPSKRMDKTAETTNADGSTTAVNISVARLSIPMQKQIVMLAAAFLCGNPIQLTAAPAGQAEIDFLAVLKRAWEDNKLDYDSKNLAKLMMAETEVAEIWYTEPIKPGYWKGTAFDVKNVVARLRMKIVANKFGDQLFPIYNSSGDMIAFGRGYAVTVGDTKVDHFDLYTEENYYLMVKDNTGWTVTPATNPFGKIPVIYYGQETPEWHDVQEMIDRLEKSLSNHGDTNDYNGSPIIKVKGKITGFSKKGESGKVLEMENDADANYLSWDSAPESIKLEQENLRSFIFSMTNTPDISLENMKSLGVFSGIALKMLFLGAHLKAADKEETFGKSIQRRINFLKKALTIINTKFEEQESLTIKPKFEYYLPKNDQELIDMLSTATAAKATMSQKTAVAANPLVTDTEAEMKLIGEDTQAAAFEEPA